jgi:hypothetical protein
MNKATPPLREFARRLIELEANAIHSSQEHLPVAFLVCEKLRSHLTTLMGKTGFRALLARSLVLGAAEVPWLGTITVGADGGWRGFGEAGVLDDPAQVADGGVVLLARFVGLLTAFIGEDLTVRLIREIWPELTLDDLDLKPGDAR